MPSGMRLPFRYDQKWVAPRLLTALGDGKAGQVDGAHALVVYVDQADPLREPLFIPCRTATIVNPLLLGQTVSLELELGSPVLAPDLGEFQSEMRSSTTDRLPHWTDEGVGGSYWLESTRDLSIEGSADLATWELVVQQLSSRADFDGERFFYVVQALVDVANKKTQSVRDSRFLLRANREYAVRLYHFHPDRGDPSTLLRLDATQQSLVFTSNPEVTLDSRYDLKQVRFRTGLPAARELELITIRRKSTSEADWDSEFEIPVHIRGTFWRRFGIAVLIGIFLSAPQIVQTYNDGDLSDESRLMMVIVFAVSGLAAGIVAAFALRRSL